MMYLSLMDPSENGFWFTGQPKVLKLTVGDVLLILVQSFHSMALKIRLNWLVIISVSWIWPGHADLLVELLLLLEYLFIYLFF